MRRLKCKAIRWTMRGGRLCWSRRRRMGWRSHTSTLRRSTAMASGHSHTPHRGETTQCKVTPVILHGLSSPEWALAHVYLAEINRNGFGSLPTPRAQTPNPKPKTQTPKPPTPNPKPKPQTSNPKPQTPNRRHQTPNPEPRTLNPTNPKPYFLDPQPYTIRVTPNPRTSLQEQALF